MIRTVIFATVITLLLAGLDLVAAFFIYVWSGGDFGGLGSPAHAAGAWAFPAWSALTVAFLTLDVYAVRRVRRATRA